MFYKKNKVLVDRVSQARLLNRYIALVQTWKYDTSRGIAYNNVVVEEKSFFQIQWKNISADILGLLNNPFATSPRVAYSLLAFFFIFIGNYDKSFEVAFLMGSVAYDADAQTNHSGEPSTITWEHTIGSGSDRLININVSGLSTPNDPEWDGNSTTAINSVGATKTSYYLNPSTGAADCTADGGNIKVGGSISFEGVDQTDPIGATATEDGSSSPNDMSLTTEEDDSMRVDVLGANRDDSTSPTGSLDSGDLRCNDVVPQNQFRIGLFAYTNFQATAGADTHQWTTSGFNRWYSAFEIKGSSSGTAHTKDLSEVISATDSILKTPTRMLTDIITPVDNLIKTPTRILTDIITPSDTLVKTSTKNLVDNITPADLLIKSTTRSLTEIVTPVDSLIRTIGRSLVDVITPVDTIQSSKVTSSEHTEVITPSDSIEKTTTRTLSDSVTTSDIFERSITKVYSEVVTVIDTFSGSFGRTLSEAISVADSITKTTTKVLSDTITSVDSVVKATTRVISETITVLDGDTVTLNPSDYTGYINSLFPTSNFNTAGITLGERNDQANQVKRPLLKFPIDDTNQIPAGVYILDSKLRLYIDDDRSDNARTARVYRSLRAWIGSQVTWNEWSSGNSWTTAGGYGSGDSETSDIGNRSFTATETVPEYKEFTLDTDAIEAMLSGGSFTNNGFLLKMDTESNDAYRGSAGNAVSNKHELVITYTHFYAVVVTNKVLSEVISVADSIAKTLTRVIGESISVIDSINSSGIQATLSEIVTVTDSFLRSIVKQYTESISVVDTITKVPTRILSEVITTTDSIIKYLNGFIPSIWTKTGRAASGIWSKTSKATGGIWTKTSKAAGSIWTKKERP